MIIVPVLALGAVGLWQLRKDRAAALADARAEVEDKLEQVLGFAKSVPIVEERSGTPDIIFSHEGEVLWPKLIPLVPSPLVGANPHAERLNQLLTDPRLSQSEQSLALHELALEENSGVSTAGFPVRQLALRNALRFGKEAGFDKATLKDWAFDLIVDAVKHPTILSARLIEEAKEYRGDSFEETGSWNRELESWSRAEASGKFLRENASVVQGLLTEVGDQDRQATVSKWIGTDSEVFGQLRQDDQEAFLYLQTLEEIRKRVEDRIEEISIPRHLGIRLKLGGRLVFGDPAAEVLSMVNDSESEVRAEIVFIDREAFFQPIRQRSNRTAWIIAFAVLAAGIGWFAAWRAFIRQRQLSAMKDNFVSAVSHELKAPIASIGLMAEELGAGSSKRLDYSRLIAGECKRLGSLVENVLDYARIESGSEEFTFEDADLGELVRAIADLMRPAAAERDIEIRVEAPWAGELCATVDARAIGRAVVNLLDNAIKYAPRGEPVVITAREDRIMVADKGAPIPAGEGRKIFERFYRSGDELTRETKGVGIGLSLVSHIARAHSGEVRVESDQSGNRFILRIGNPDSKSAT